MAERLMSIGYRQLFQEPSEEALDAIWAGGEARRRLEAVALASEMPDAARFLAVEVLYERGPGAFPPPRAFRTLAPVYASALAQNLAGMANPWGLPGTLDGPVAEHALGLGRSSLDAFRPLLGDATPLLYGGSQDATLGNSYRFRVKDVAASIVSRIAGIPFDPDPDPVARDREIERVIGALSELPDERRDER
jgi:hypothetical protein